MGLIIVVSMLSVAAVQPPRVTVFEGGMEGFPIYRIPGLVITKAGTLLAYCEARSRASDWGRIRVVGKRSTDDGKTWGPLQQLNHADANIRVNPVAILKKLGLEGVQTWNSPVMIADPVRGTVHLIYSVENYRAFHRISTDDGQTWGPPREITDAFDAFKMKYEWKVFAIGPGHGITLKSGRLVTGVWLSTATGGNAHHPSVTATIYSDDAGQTWHAGAIAAADTPEFPDPNESAIAELSDGRVMLNIRTISGTHRRAVTTSPDGATGWSAPRFDDALIEPICYASLVRIPGQAKLVFSNPNNLEIGKGTPKPGQGRDRKNLTLRLSEDDGQTWPHQRVLEPGGAGYSDLAATADGRIYCLFEKGKTGNNGNLYLSTLNADWIRQGSKP